MIIFDWDGTLIDLWPRYYAVFRDITGQSNISFQEYKCVKQKLLKDSLVAEHFMIKLPENYFELKKIMLEEKEYLLLDKLFFNQEELKILLNWKDVGKQNGGYDEENSRNGHREDCIILSKRRNIPNFYWQINNLGLQCTAYAVEDKTDWLRSRMRIRIMETHTWTQTQIQKHIREFLIEENLVIGDSKDDLNMAAFPNVTAWIVGYGLNGEDQIKSLGMKLNIPYRFLQNPSDLVNAVRTIRERSERRNCNSEIYTNNI